MILAELDPIQIAIIVIAMGAGFVQWLWGLIKQNMGDKERRNAAPISPEERAAREEAWRKQVEHTQQGRPNRPSPQAPTPAHDPWSSVRDVFEQLKEEARKAQQPATPPPLPQQERPTPVRRRVHPATVRAELHPAPEPPPVPADPFPAGSARSAPISSTPPVFFATPPPPRLLRPSIHATGPDFRGLREKLHNPASLKQAVLFREILGPPKALQSAEDSPF